MGQKNTSSWCYTMKCSWNRKQNFVALSTREVEYISVRSNMASQTSDIFTWPWYGSYDDNQESCVKLLENPLFLDGSKHDEMKYPYIRDMMQTKNRTHAVPSYTWADCRHLHQTNLVKNAFPVQRDYWWLQPRQNSKYIRVRLGMMKNVSLAERECWWL